VKGDRRISNAEIAERLSRTADLLELDGANAFRVRAYRGAAETVAAHPASLAAMVLEGADLTTLKGIGKDLAGGIAALVRDGTLPQFEALRVRVPLGLLEVVRVPGVGPKRAHTLWQHLGVEDLASLERAARAERVADLPGFGAKTQAKILAGIEGVRRRQARVRLNEAEALVGPLLELLVAVPGVRRAAVAGSLRRGRETIGDVDLVVSADDAAPVSAALREAEGVLEVLARGDTKTSVLLAGGLQVDLRVVADESFGAALAYFTGSKAHNVALRQRAVDQGCRLSEYGLMRLGTSTGRGGRTAEAAGGATPTVDAGGVGSRAGTNGGERLLAGAEEADVYAALGLPWIPPELREDRGEIAAAEAGRLPALIESQDIRGDLHWHTTWSDGVATPEAMVAACAARGYAYAAITDHSQALRMTGGLDAAKLTQQWQALDALDEARRAAVEAGPALLRGLEVDILKDGRLDLDDAWLERLELVIVSVHSYFDLPQARQTARMVAAVQHPQVNLLAHPSGRLLGRRDGYDVDLDAVFEAAAAAGVAIECNASPSRLDAGDTELMRAVRAGCTVAINTDAHAPSGLDDMRYGVLTARRAWLTAEHVLNAWPLSRVRRFLARGR
jgi:DNA polymerase (family X)